MNRTQEAMDVLVAADPVAERTLEGWALSTEGQLLFNGIVRDRPRVQQRARVARLPLRSIATASAVMLIVGVVATRTNDTPRSRTPRVAVAGASDVLRDAALVAARSGPEAGPGQWIYRKFEGQGTGTRDVNGRQITALIPTSIEVWISHDDGSGRILGRSMAPKFLNAEDEQWWIAAGRPAFSDVGTFEKVMPAAGAPEDITTYPTDADDLYAFLTDKADATTQCPEAKSGESVECPPRGDPDMYVFTAASDLLLNHPDASPKLRSALFEVMSRVPGTELDPDVTDPSGREGTSVSVVVGEDGGRSQRHEMYFDPKSAEVLGFRDVFLETGGSEVTYAYSVLLKSGVVDESGQRP
ncbi:MAG: hypothetical protein QOH26_1933 [Actinomycetota bacterium]|nr:hypothetical protein [Actinomycetota bacterium]